MEAELGIPTVALITAPFRNLVAENALKKGMPNLRVTYVPSPVWGKSKEQLTRYLTGANPVSGKPVMEEIVAHLTQPLAAEDRQTRVIEQSAGPASFGPDTADNLQRLFRERGLTDNLPIILPTEEKVAAMLRGTSHGPDEVVGRMAATPGVFEFWSYTVRTVAVNAVMAGAEPKYFPVILALAAAGEESISSSDNSFARAVVINGPIRDEIGLNYEIGALGPFGHANSTIGRSWTLLSINGGNAGKVGTTYMGVIGNPTNWINIVIAENEAASPWQPLHVRKGFKADESVISTFTGWGVISAKNSVHGVWAKEMNFASQLKNIFAQQDPMFGAVAVLSPTVANYLKDEGYDSAEKLLAELAGGSEGGGRMPGSRGYELLVTGGYNNLYYDYGGMRYGRSVSVDTWR
ncbi:MAG: hypothetical protein IT494_07580 [Gammaproteobacteria bacterium]|nr:hypothetical protein [Gammaproteobacteria bacterium]